MVGSIKQQVKDIDRQNKLYKHTDKCIIRIIKERVKREANCQQVLIPPNLNRSARNCALEP
jgi:ribosomal protein L31E